MRLSKEQAEAINNYLNGKASTEEKKVVNDWYYAFNDEEVEIPTEIKDLHNQIQARLLSRIQNSINNKPARINKLRNTYALTAASLLVLLSAALYISNRKPNAPPITAKINPVEIKPGGNKAILTLANGQKIDLTNAKIGDLTSQGGIKISHTKNGEILYQISSAKLKDKNPEMMNTIETPNGGQYQINLPDGTKIWLNAASSLKYPVQFAAHERTVQLTGEGYFEVAKDKSRPFKVITAQQNIEVLGTHFDVNSYTDEQYTKTTLLEGSVKVSPTKGNAILLKPGQQSILKENTLKIQSADLESVMAWKNGHFMFDGEDLESIMRKVSKWYNVEVIYQHKPTDVYFTGIVSRSKNLNAVIRALESTGKVHFKMEDKRITVF